MQQLAYTIFLPATDTTFEVYPDLLEEIHLAKCVILQAKELVSFYVIGWSAGKLDAPDDLVEIYYVISDWQRSHILCARMWLAPSGYVQAVPMSWVPPGLRSFDEFDLSTRSGRALRKERFQPRLLPVSRRQR